MQTDAGRKSELRVITAAKDLCRYVMTVTHKSPKEFRFTYTVRLQNLSIDIVEALYRANDVFVTREHRETYRERYAYMRKAVNSIRLMLFLAELSVQQKAILMKQYEQIAKQGTEVLRLTGAWIVSDKKRLGIGNPSGRGVS
ncbi:MAG: four helix bundle protein [Lachnospiraceae bacterium]|nr:four helix bundle protein [Lachnospiraceae bacterium]